jgi:hypothetical protein
MASIYAKRGVWYAPDWTNPHTGRVVAAHPLCEVGQRRGTKDRARAEVLWEREKAHHILSPGGIAQQVERLTFNQRVAGSSPAAPTHGGARIHLSAAVEAYLRSIAGGIKPATLAGYRKHAALVLRHFGDPWIDSIDDVTILAWLDSEAKRLDGRTHTVVKRYESILKPTLRHMFERRQLAHLPVLPKLRSDYRSVGKQRTHWSREEFAAVRRELPEVDIMTRTQTIDGKRTVDGPRLVVYPRTWVDLAVTTGMHPANIDRFQGAHFDAARGIWFRQNSKSDAIYEPEWLPVDVFMAEVLSKRRVGAQRLFVAELDAADVGELAENWMRHRLKWACRRAGVTEITSANHLRRTFATWRKEEGWEFEETARWLANSSGMVREVYAQMAPRAMVRAVGRSKAHATKLLKLTRDLDGPRRGAQQAKLTESHGSENGSKLTEERDLSHGKLSR